MASLDRILPSHYTSLYYLKKKKRKKLDFENIDLLYKVIYILVSHLR